MSIESLFKILDIEINGPLLFILQIGPHHFEPRQCLEDDFSLFLIILFQLDFLLGDASVLPIDEIMLDFEQG